MADLAPRFVGGALLPPRLQDLARPPRGVYVVGELPRGPAVAIVGTRHPSPEARRFAFRLARDLARAGLTVLSGGAQGIDAAAHLGAMRGRGPTVVVGPGGYYRPYPDCHRRLFERVVAHGGAYLSLRRPKRPALRGGFFARNACLVALAHAVVVVEARYRSGARNAANWARRLGRPILVVPSTPWSSTGRGCVVELRLGAKVCGGPADVLDALEQALVLPTRPKSPARELEAEQIDLPFAAPLEPGSSPPAARLVHPPEQSVAPEDDDAHRVLAAVWSGARHLDAVCERSGLSPATTQRLILTLTLEGVLAADPAGGLRAVPAGRSVSASKQPK
jgi:DNA processing protein